jgi:DamX protein
VGFNTAGWLLRQDPNRYTLQLVTLSEHERATELIARQPDPGEFAVFRNRRNGQVFYVITYGVFSSRSAAERAAASLQGELRNLTPWIRPFSLVQEAVRATPQ